ncbi:hypothetical protein [Brevundimonas sp.]|uniref:hypothetical protein n=1 Tax=Brevundimonas sp. TaxID=1871086 RepID=UPI002ABBA5CA|nr:hypothetical protein [Brevundimonas sp.]MDZ4362876.1 hypothetical protein [Brevundimonas sp.]
MTVVPYTDLTTTPDVLLDKRAVWTAPVLELFDMVSAELGASLEADFFNYS